jgi:signal transduction histidine kinase/DNA-binding response OmpR family regulator/HAMP domain-containing protein
VRGFSIARSLQVALLGLTIVLAVVAALGIASLYDSRQRYEDRLARTYELEAAASNLLAAGVLEDAALRRTGQTGRTAAAAARRAFDTVAADARRIAADDAQSARLVADRVAAQDRLRSAALARTGESARINALRPALRISSQLAERQRERRADARRIEKDDARGAVLEIAIAGGLAILAALALVAALISRLRRPLDELVAGTRRLAAGELGRRVEASGPVELRELGASFNAMASDLELARAQLETERRLLATTIESLGDALVVCDDQDHVTAVNPRAQELVPELAPGSGGHDDGSPLPPLRDALTGEVFVEHGQRTFGITAALLGEDSGTVWTIRDITERARLDRMKSEFVATASHELRSPLTSVKGFAELLLMSDKLGPREREFAEVINDSTDRMVSLVNELLDAASIEAGRIEIRQEAVDVASVAEDVATLLRPRLEDGRQTLTLDYERPLPEACADPERVRQILMNLLTNAHLYTPAGGQIGVALAPDGDTLRIDVSDNGRGMSQEQLDQVFDRFFRADEAGSSPGTGLGLSIVRSLVDMMDGTISAVSQLGEGTSFTVRLPLARASGAEPPPPASLYGARVLVIDDDAGSREATAEALGTYGIEVVTTGDADEALTRARSERFDAVALDVLMPGMRAFGLLHDMRADPQLAALPVVLMSGYPERAAFAGAPVVGKPVVIEDLVRVLGRAVGEGRARVLVLARQAVHRRLRPLLDERGISYEWARDADDAARRCAKHYFEVALVDAGVEDLEQAVAALDLRGRRGDERAVVIFSDDDEAPGYVRLETAPLPIEHAIASVIEVLEEHDGVAG